MLIMKDYDRANHHLQSALDLFQQTNELYGHMGTLIKMGYVALERRDYFQAGRYFQAGLERARKVGTRRRLVNCILGFGGIALGVGELGRSACLFGAAEALVKVTGSRHDQPDEEAINLHNLAELRTALDEKTFAAAWAEGEQMNLEETIAYALEGLPRGKGSENKEGT
jgi:tetratricopeptide (TPR) repeat protein